MICSKRGGEGSKNLLHGWEGRCWEGVGGRPRDGRRTRVLPGRGREGETTAAHGHSVRE